MALIQLGPAAVAPPPPVGVAALRQDAGLTLGSARDMISVVRDGVQLWKEMEPLLKMLRPPAVEYADVGQRAPAPEIAARHEAAPPPAEVAAAAKEVDAAAEKARVELRGLIEAKMSKNDILQLVAGFGPMVIEHKLPKLGKILEKHAAETDVWLQSFTEAELKEIIVEILPMIPAKDVPYTKGLLAQMVKDAAPAVPAAEPPAVPAAEPKKGESA